MADRTILHSDLNSFYASVEIRNNPTLADKPVAVGGDEQARHGIVLAANPLAKQYGIRTAETLWSARRKCPDLVIVPRISTSTTGFLRRYARFTWTTPARLSR